MKLASFGLAGCLSALSLAAHANDVHSGHGPGVHASTAPIGIMGDHTHHAGGWMLSYRYMHMEMDGMRDGNDDLSDAEVLSDFMVTPTRMTTDMHMLGAMYAPNDRLTILAMVPWVRKSMDHVTRMGVRFTTGSEGLGDVKLGALYVLKRWRGQQLHLNMSVSLPSGDIDETDDTPAANDAQLPYPMQLGSGTWDLLPGVTYLGQRDAYAWGAQVLGTVRIGENDNDYTLGDRLELNGWTSYRFSDPWSVSARLRWQSWGEIDGRDDQLNPLQVPTADPDLQGGTRADALIGVNFYAHSGVFKGHRLAIEGGVPVYENLDGPQMSADWMATAGWQYAFD